MALQYALYKNHLTTAEQDHCAIPQNVDSYQLEDLLEEMVVPGGVTQTQAAAVLESFMGVQEKVLKRGASINTEFYNIYPRISGVFENNEDTFDPSRHQITLSTHLGTRFEPIPEMIQVQKVAANDRIPYLSSFIDSATGSVNQSLTPGKAGEIKGVNLKLDTEDENQGVFFVSGETEYRCAIFMRNTSKTLMFLLPDTMDGGEYTVVVKAMIPGTKTIREGRLPSKITVS